MDKHINYFQKKFFEDRQKEFTRLSLERDVRGVALQSQRDSYIQLNTFNLDMTQDLYHVIKYKYLIGSLENKCLFMKKPTDWEDIYDIFLLNTLARDRDGSWVSLDEIKKKMYFQCWSKTEESKELWDARSLGGDIELVKIKTSVGKLMNWFYNINNESHRNTYFIGNVEYVDEKYIDKLRGSDINGYIINEGEHMIGSLFLKMKKYEFENEARLLFYAVGDPSKNFGMRNLVDINNDIFSFPIDTNNIIEEIVLHPKLDDVTCAKMIDEIQTLGYNGNVRKSMLSM